MTLWELNITFFKFGLLCFGGGYMLVPLLSADLVGSAPGAPLTPEAFANLVSIAQVTPGPIAWGSPPRMSTTSPGFTLSLCSMESPVLYSPSSDSRKKVSRWKVSLNPTRR